MPPRLLDGTPKMIFKFEEQYHQKKFLFALGDLKFMINNNNSLLCKMVLGKLFEQSSFVYLFSTYCRFRLFGNVFKKTAKIYGVLSNYGNFFSLRQFVFRGCKLTPSIIPTVGNNFFKIIE